MGDFIAATDSISPFTAIIWCFYPMVALVFVELILVLIVDWLVEVHLKFKLVPETLYLTVNLIDRYLVKTEVSRPKLQLVGVTALLIASKYEEIYPPELRDLVYICDRAYSKLEVRFVCLWYAHHL